MKRLINITSGVCFTLLVFGMLSCDNNSIDDAEPISPDGYPTATVTATNLQGDTVTEGDTLMYNIALDKPLEKPITIEMKVSGGTADASDYIAQEVTIPAFEADTTFQFPVIFLIDDVPEESEMISFTVSDDDVGTKYSLNPASQFPSENLTIENRNNPNGLTVVLDWENPADDLDMFAALYLGGEYAGALADGATGDKPETIVETEGLAGEWYYAIDPFAVNQNVINYTFSIGYPDQSIESFEGSFNADDSTTNVDPNLGNRRFLKATSALNGSGNIEYTVENLNPGSSDN